jgi:Protein of unknown function (DUF3467)
MENEQTVNIQFMKSESFRQIYIIGAVGGHTPYDFRIGFYNDENKVPEDGSTEVNIERRVETEIILSPIAALELNHWLTLQIKEYETKFGPILKNEKQSHIQGYM